MVPAIEKNCTGNIAMTDERRSDHRRKPSSSSQRSDKHEATNTAARGIIATEKTASDAKTAKLREQRLAKESADLRAAGDKTPSAAKRPTKVK
jgi:hypothetical protein